MQGGCRNANEVSPVAQARGEGSLKYGRGGKDGQVDGSGCCLEVDETRPGGGLSIRG